MESISDRVDKVLLDLDQLHMILEEIAEGMRNLNRQMAKALGEDDA